MSVGHPFQPQLADMPSPDSKAARRSWLPTVMKFGLLPGSFCLLVIGLTFAAPAAEPPAPAKSEWQALFNGRDLSNWDKYLGHAQR